jgi:hypothetical protein
VFFDAIPMSEASKPRQIRRPGEGRDIRVSACAHRDTAKAINGPVDSCLRNNEGLWLWVPAFAGTTRGEIVASNDESAD